MLLRLAAFIVAIAALVLTQIDFSSGKAQSETAAVAAATLDLSDPTANTESSDFVIAGGEGYGATECLAGTGQCGKIVADAWCGSKGFARASAWRAADRDEITASVGRRSDTPAFVISCAAK